MANEVEVYEAGELERQELTVDQLVARQAKIKEAMGKAMEQGVHYGTIPGTRKPSLWKAGAETLLSLFMLDPEYDSQTSFDEEGHFHVKSKVTLFHIPSGNRVSSGEGYCSTAEKRYAFKKKNEPRPKSEFPELYNTIVKMAGKRALVAAVLNFSAASDVFTQDLEDMPRETRAAQAPVPLTAETKADVEKWLTLLSWSPAWKPEAMLAQASRAFGRAIQKVEDLHEHEATQIVNAASEWSDAHPAPVDQTDFQPVEGYRQPDVNEVRDEMEKGVPENNG
jgi:hypothetical protein